MLRRPGLSLAHLAAGSALASRFGICVQVRPIVCARWRFMTTTGPTPPPAAVPIGDKVSLPIRFTWPIASTLADLAKFGWSVMSTLADQIHNG